MDERIVNMAYDILSILLPVLAVMLAEWLRRKIGVERLARIQRELETKKELAALAVKFVEQAYKDLKGEEKFQEAAQWLATQAIDRGINITADEIRGLIESTLRAFKDTFGEDWAKAGA
ncbi:MAG TPA: holin [Firmicutes bacterium]|nr:holin [Bacillota bacterium]